MAKPSHLFVFLFDIRCISDSITTTQMRDKYVMYTKWSLQHTKILKGIIMRQCTTMQCYGAVLCALNNASAPCRRGQCCVRRSCRHFFYFHLFFWFFILFPQNVFSEYFWFNWLKCIRMHTKFDQYYCFGMNGPPTTKMQRNEKWTKINQMFISNLIN